MVKKIRGMILYTVILLLFSLSMSAFVYATCIDIDGVNYLYPGFVYDGDYWDDYCVRDYDPGYATDSVIEFVCVGGAMTAYDKDCKDFGYWYICDAGACVENLTECYDSDGGSNWYNKGYVIDQYGDTVWDDCVGGGSQDVWDSRCVLGESITDFYDCADIGYTCEDGACIAGSGYSCVDSDGGAVLETKGVVTLYLNGVYDDNFTDYCYTYSGNTYLREGVTTGCASGAITFYEYSCPESCYNGACVPNQMPFFYNVTSYRYETPGFVPPYHHHPWYATGDKIFWTVNASDLEDDDIYVAVDCDIEQTPYVTNWYHMSNTTFFNCTYDDVDVYTARIYTTQSGTWNDYTDYKDDTVYIRDCVNYLDCPSGYWCSPIGACYLPSNVTNCTDTDYGINYTQFGILTTPVTVKNDTCNDGFTVDEYFCNPGYPGGYSFNRVSCKNIGDDYICYQGECTNTTDTLPVTFNIKDMSTGLGLSGIHYDVVRNMDYQLIASGTVNSGVVTLSIPPGYSYQIIFEDLNNNYKDWYEKFWYATTPVAVNMERECTGNCLFTDAFSYTDLPYHHGWQGADYSVLYDGTLGLVAELDGVSSWYNTFREPTSPIITINYMLQMSDILPGDGQGIKFVMQDIDGNDIFTMRYYIDLTGKGVIYYFSDASWHTITPAQDVIPLEPVTTKLIYTSSTKLIDIYVDSQTTGTYNLYATGVSADGDGDVFSRIQFEPETPVYPNRSIYVDNIDISQSTSQPTIEEGNLDPRNPSDSDTSQPWYYDSEGILHFDKDACTGWKSYIMCAGVKFGTANMAKFVSWTFSGIHLLYIILMLLLIILIGPLVIELFRKR